MVNQGQTSLSLVDDEINFSVFRERHHARCFKQSLAKILAGDEQQPPFCLPGYRYCQTTQNNNV